MQLTARCMRAMLATTLVCGGVLQAAPSASAAPPPIKHVFILMEENESEATSFGPSSPAPYLAKTLVSRGAFVPNYYGVGHSSLDNYIAMVSGQAPNPKTQGDCPVFADFAAPTSLNPMGQETGQGCVYPAAVPTVMSQLQAAGLTWRGYMDGMGANRLRDNGTTCGHPVVGFPDLTEAATPTDQYATRHDPFVYFHSVIDNHALCNANVVNLNRLPADLNSAATTPNYTFITPNLCNDGHDAHCANGGPGGLAQADTFLKTWVPKITSSPAFRQDGLLIIAFDEAVGDATACCGEAPGPTNSPPGNPGPGGGLVGAVLLSPFIKAGTKTQTAYNHYSMLGSVEDIFGLKRLADAKGTRAFGKDIFTHPPVAPQDSALKLKPTSFAPAPSAKSAKGGSTISYRDTEAGVTALTVQLLAPGFHFGGGACKVLKPGHKRPQHSTGCTVIRTIGSLTHPDIAGSNSLRFAGRLHGLALAKGSYQLEATPKLGALSGKTRTARFRIL